MIQFDMAGMKFHPNGGELRVAVMVELLGERNCVLKRFWSEGGRRKDQ